MESPVDTPRNVASLLLRALLPIAILAAGWWGFSELSQKIEQPPPQAKETRTLRTRVVGVEPIDYPIVVETNAVVQAHNRVTLTSQVRGVVVKVSPAFEVGAYFSKDDVLLEIDARDYRTAEALAKSRLESARSALRLAKLVEDRKLRLVSSNAVSRAEVDAASATREQAEAGVKMAQTDLDLAQLNLERTRVLAPFDGRVQSKGIGLGQMADTNNPLGEIFAVDFAEVRLPVSARQREFLVLPEFSDDPPVEVMLRDGISQASDRQWRAKIVRTEGVLDPDSRDLFAIARIDDPFGRESGDPPLRIGQPVTASITGVVLRDVVALPRAAVRQLDQIVLVRRSDQTLLPTTVHAIWSDAQHVIVDRASVPSDVWLATTPLVYTPEGTPVEIIEGPTSSEAIADTAKVDSESAAN
ncbi:Multidrug resistance protein MdtA precursor [Pirellulimonas nuda]|uniref:Multidrug resistance protein MdtA n=1 Tax=Pirellulimonas nuda TaxID=2528009 RepID=A0A518DE43_9BACT|nr:efflux RND transporter periplasmic adaptor subunit [Pirellulimonas nuda]QDU89736.1 Multidrug resistance protein MdtA precursor [Pirellulimonas nuda]